MGSGPTTIPAMRRVALILLLCAWSSPALLRAQTPVPAPSADASPAALVRQWLERLNALSDAPATLDAFVALYAPDALHIAGPTADQRGTATYRGHAGIRVMASRLAARCPMATSRPCTPSSAIGTPPPVSAA